MWGTAALGGARPRPLPPESVERPGVQQGQQFSFGTGEVEAVVQGLERGHHQGCLPPAAPLQLLDGGPEEGARCEPQGTGGALPPALGPGVLGGRRALRPCPRPRPHPPDPPEVVVEGVGRQEVDVAEEDVGREGLGQGHVAELVDGVEGTLPVHHVVGHVLPGREHRRGLQETQELLGLCICQVQGQAHGARPVPAQGFQHL